MSEKEKEKRSGGSGGKRSDASAAAPTPSAASRLPVDPFAFGTDPGASEDAKVGMINDLESMLRLMDAGNGDGVDEFLQYLLAAKDEMVSGAASEQQMGRARPREDPVNAKKKPVAQQKLRASAATSTQKPTGRLASNASGSGTTTDAGVEQTPQDAPVPSQPLTAPDGSAKAEGSSEIDQMDCSVSTADAQDIGVQLDRHLSESQGTISRILDALFSGAPWAGLEGAAFEPCGRRPSTLEEIMHPDSDLSGDSQSHTGSGRSGTEQSLASLTAPLSLQRAYEPRGDVPFDFLEEDLRDINTLISRMAPISQRSLEELCDFWQLSRQNVDHLMMRTNIAERVRCLAVLFLLTVGRKFGAIPQSTLDDLVENLSLCLWQGAALLGPQSQQHVAVLFDLDCTASHEEICITVTGLGLTAFFQPVPLDTLTRIATELKLPALQADEKDSDLRNEIITHQLCRYFYPLLDSRPDMKLPCTVHLRVHENGHGKFTCTVDNARMMTVGLHQNHSSNGFSVNKIRFRARLLVSDQKLSFWISHQSSTPLTIVLQVRAAGSTKPGKAGAPPPQEVPGAKGGPFALASTPLEVPVGGRIGFNHMLTLEEVFRSPRNSPHGLRLYSDDDRVTFQFSVEIVATKPGSNPHSAQAQPARATAGKGTAQAPPGSHAKVQAPESKVPRASEPSAAAPAQPPAAKVAKKPPTPDPQVVAKNAAALLAAEEEEKRRKAAAKGSQKLEKRFTLLEVTEGVARETVVKAATTAWQTLVDETQKSWQRCLSKRKERERKEEQSREDLHNQVSGLQGTVVAARTAVAKLAGERTTLSKDLAKVTSATAARRSVLEALQQKLQESKAALEEQERELSAVEEEHVNRQRQLADYEKAKAAQEGRRAARHARREQREADRQKRRKLLNADPSVWTAPAPVAPTNRPTDPAAVDYQSFWVQDFLLGGVGSMEPGLGAGPGLGASGLSGGMSLFGDLTRAFGSQASPLLGVSNGYTQSVSTVASHGPVPSSAGFHPQSDTHFHVTAQEALALETASISSLSPAAPPFISAQMRRGMPGPGMGGMPTGPPPRSRAPYYGPGSISPLDPGPSPAGPNGFFPQSRTPPTTPGGVYTNGGHLPPNGAWKTSSY